jgi:hypothetical protein
MSRCGRAITCSRVPWQHGVLGMQEHPDVVEACSCLLLSFTSLESVLGILVTLKPAAFCRHSAPISHPSKPGMQHKTDCPACHEEQQSNRAVHSSRGTLDATSHPPACLMAPHLEAELRTLFQGGEGCLGADCVQPALVGLLASMPLTSSGKVDRHSVQRLCSDLLCQHQKTESQSRCKPQRPQTTPPQCSQPQTPQRGIIWPHQISVGSLPQRKRPRADMEDSARLMCSEVCLARPAAGRESSRQKSTWQDVEGALHAHVDGSATTATLSALAPLQQSMRNVTESEVMWACTKVLWGIMDRTQGALEPCTNLLAMGATSMHAAAIAALLDAPLDIVYRGLSPRGVAKQMNSSVQASDSRSRLSRSLYICDLPEASKEVTKWTELTQSVSRQKQECTPASARTYQTDGNVCSAQAVPTDLQEEVLPQATDWSTQVLMECTSGLDLCATSSHGETLKVKVPQRYAPLYELSEASTAARQAFRESLSGAKQSSLETSIAPKQASHEAVSGVVPRRLTCMLGCVDAPLVGMEYSCASLAHQCSRHPPQSWIVACSHGGDVACLHVSTGLRAWTTQVGGSPDAGGQVTANGRCLAIALLDGLVQLLQIRDGLLLSFYNTGGQLRRCVVASFVLHGVLAADQCA